MGCHAGLGVSDVLLGAGRSSDWARRPWQGARRPCSSATRASASAIRPARVRRGAQSALRSGDRLQDSDRGRGARLDEAVVLIRALGRLRRLRREVDGGVHALRPADLGLGPAGPAAPKALAAAATDPATIVVDPLVGLERKASRWRPSTRGTTWPGRARISPVPAARRSTHFRPIQPKEVIPLASADARGALITGLTSELAGCNRDRHSWPALLRSRLLAPGCRRVGKGAGAPLQRHRVPVEAAGGDDRVDAGGRKGTKARPRDRAVSGDQGRSTRPVSERRRCSPMWARSSTSGRPAPRASRRCSAASARHRWATADPTGLSRVPPSRSTSPTAAGRVERVLVGYKDGNDR